MVSKVTFEDLFDIEVIENQCFYDAYTQPMLKSSFNSSSFYGLKCRMDGRIVGYLLITKVLDEANIDRVAVVEEYRKRKIATLLINTAEKELKKAGVNSVFLEVRRDNALAVNLYNFLNYEQISVRNNYYGNGVDALIYKKVL